MSNIEYPLEAISSEAQLRTFVGKTLWVVTPVEGHSNPFKFDFSGVRTYEPKRYIIMDNNNAHDRGKFWINNGEAAPPFDEEKGMYAFIFSNYWLAVGYALRIGRLKQIA